MSALRVGVAVLVTLVWAVTYVSAIFTHVGAPPELSFVMLAVVTWLFGSELRRLRTVAKKILDETDKADES